jgi:hypothetical protein
VSQKDGKVWLKLQAGCMTFFGLPGTKQEHMPCLFEGFIEDFDPRSAEETWDKSTDDVPNDFLDEQGQPQNKND